MKNSMIQLNSYGWGNGVGLSGIAGGERGGWEGQFCFLFGALQSYLYAQNFISLILFHFHLNQFFIHLLINHLFFIKIII